MAVGCCRDGTGVTTNNLGVSLVPFPSVSSQSNILLFSSYTLHLTPIECLGLWLGPLLHHFKSSLSKVPSCASGSVYCFTFVVNCWQGEGTSFVGWLISHYIDFWGFCQSSSVWGGGQLYQVSPRSFLGFCSQWCSSVGSGNGLFSFHEFSHFLLQVRVRLYFNLPWTVSGTYNLS